MAEVKNYILLIIIIFLGGCVNTEKNEQLHACALAKFNNMPEGVSLQECWRLCELEMND